MKMTLNIPVWMCGVCNFVEVKRKVYSSFSLPFFLPTAPLPFSPPFDLPHPLSACEYEQYFDIELLEEESETGMEKAESYPTSLPHLIIGEDSDVSLNIPTKGKIFDDSGEWNDFHFIVS